MGKRILILILGVFAVIAIVAAQEPKPDLPDAPSVATQNVPGQSSAEGKQSTSMQPDGRSGPQESRGYGPMAPFLSVHPPSERDKWNTYTHRTFGPPAMVFPAIGAGLRLVHPPKGYPPDWTDGASAFGREYGNTLAVQTSKRTAALLTESILHEDSRYVPARPGVGAFGRIGHAVAFTFFDRTDSGRKTFAFNNIAAAAAGGFVGNAYLPQGFNDATHAGQRAISEFAALAFSSVTLEFSPELAPIVRRLHIPKIVPAWWVPDRQQHP